MDYVYNYNDMQFFAETKNDIEEECREGLLITECTYMRIWLGKSAKKRRKAV